MTRPYPRLDAKAQRGSKPRCHLLTEGAREAVARRLTKLAAPWAEVATTDYWMPDGFVATTEAELHRRAALLDHTISDALGEWWLPAGHHSARTPNWDIASTCTLNGRRGLLLIEAKAHATELVKESAGRSLAATSKGDQAARDASHQTIGLAIETARVGPTSATGTAWAISRDSHYQLSNRFAWSWKVAEMGIPVVLIYLGFLGSEEMADRGPTFRDHKAWESLVRDQSSGIIPDTAWESSLSIAETPLIPIIRTVTQPLTEPGHHGAI